ncbi:hypothetical protein ACFX2J_035321 [Malus domestica]
MRRKGSIFSLWGPLKIRIMLILVFELLPELLWYRPNAAVYVKANRHPGKCKQPEKARELFEAMIEEGCDVNTVSYTALVSAYGNSGQIETMEKCSERFQSAGIQFQANIATFNILLDCYGKAGKYENMSAVMEYMQKYHYSWTITTYNVVIDAFGRAGDLKQMEYLFRLMRSERIKPSCVTLKAARSVRVEPSVLSSSIESPTSCFSTNNSSPPPNWKGKPKTY